MPHDRRAWRTVLILIGVVSSAVPIGCMRSSNLRPDGGSMPELSPAGEPQAGARTVAAPGQEAANGPQAAASIGQPPRATLPPDPVVGGAADPTVLQAGAPTSPPAATEPAIGPQPALGPQPATAPAESAEAPKPDAPPTSTPLLDAEIRRVEDLTQQHFESLHANSSLESPAPTSTAPTVRPMLDLEAAKPAAPAIEPGATPTPRPAPATPVESIAEPAQLPIFLPSTPDERSPTGPSLPAPVAPDGKGASPAMRAGPETADGPRPDPSRDPEREAREGTAVERIGDPARADEGTQASAPATPERQQPGIAGLQLCGKIRGFGEFEPLDATALRAGQLLLAYWEINGLEYEARGDAFVTRLSAHFELRHEGGGPPVWEQSLPTAVKECRRRLRDNYVSARIRLPGSLAPGPYRLRLIQTDLVAERTTSAEIPLTIVP